MFGLRMVLAALLLAVAPPVVPASGGPSDASLRATHQLAVGLPLDVIEAASEASDELAHTLVLFDVPVVDAPCVVRVLDEAHAPARLPVFSHVTPRRGPPQA
jgi:hypothetical protein